MAYEIFFTHEGCHGCNIYKHGKDSSEYRVSSLKNFRVILNHFDKYPLITKKLGDYFLFKQSVDF